MHTSFRADVIVFADKTLDGVHGQLADLGLAAHTAKTPSEVIWLLKADAPRFAAVLMDGDGAPADWFELLAHLAESYPTVVRCMMLAAPEGAERSGCIVVDKKRLGERLMDVLAARSASRER